MVTVTYVRTASLPFSEWREKRVVPGFIRPMFVNV